MPVVLPEARLRRPRNWGDEGREYVRSTPNDPKLKSLWNYSRSLPTKRERLVDWCNVVKAGYERDRRLIRVFRWRKRSGSTAPIVLRARAERLRREFTVLAEQWRRDTQHLSHISKKVAHPAYLRIVGMGEAVVPLLLEALRDRPAYWFAALKSTANVDPVPGGANPSEAREAWLTWGTTKGLIK